jgi:hypothetical protein
MKIASNGGSGMFGGLRTPASGDLVKGKGKAKLNPAIASNTMRTDIPVTGARIRSAHTGGRVVKPF